MKQERPILFNTDMVKAILAGRKTQSRRPLGLETFNQSKEWKFVETLLGPDGYIHAIFESIETGDRATSRVLFVKPGYLLWVRETFFKSDFFGIKKYFYKADDIWKDRDWEPSIHMPKEAARLWLEITNVRVERLQEISEEDAKAEGVEIFGQLYKNYMCKELPTKSNCWETAKNSFRTLWQSIYGSESWDANPWVWVIEFKRIEK